MIACNTAANWPVGAALTPTQTRVSSVSRHCTWCLILMFTYVCFSFGAYDRIIYWKLPKSGGRCRFMILSGKWPRPAAEVFSGATVVYLCETACILALCHRSTNSTRSLLAFYGCAAHFEVCEHGPCSQCCSLWYGRVCGVLRWLRACRGEAALIRTSPQPLCHFYSGTSLGSPHFIGEAGGEGGRKSLYAVMHYSQHRCWFDPRWHRHARRGNPPTLTFLQKGGSSRRCAGILQRSQAQPARGNLRCALILFRRCSYLVSAPWINNSPRPPTSPPPPWPKRELIRLRN